MFGVAKVQVDLDTAERSGNLIDDPRNEFFNVEGGGNALRELLQTHQFGKLLRGRVIGKTGRTEICERTGGHDETSCR